MLAVFVVRKAVLCEPFLLVAPGGLSLCCEAKSEERAILQVKDIPIENRAVVYSASAYSD
jgi:hypothetical protein